MPPKHGFAHAFTGIYKLGSTPICPISPDSRTFWGPEGGTVCSQGGERSREKVPQADALSLPCVPVRDLAKSMMQGTVGLRVNGEGNALWPRVKLV